MSPDAPADLEPVVVCLGSGGVGKTTVSAAMAMALARNGERVVVLTIDPARRLADALGLHDGLGNEPTLVRRWEDVGGELWATMLDPAETFENVIRSESASEVQAGTILSNNLFTNLATSLSGTNEYMATERLYQLHGDHRFDRVIVDTPPSRHGLDFLESPGRLHRFVNHRLYRSVFAPAGGVVRTVSAGTQVVLRMLGRIVGGRLVDDVITFFAAFQGLDQGFRHRAEAIDAVLSTRTSFVLVTAPKTQPLEEAGWIARRLRRPVSLLVVNRLCPVEPGPIEPDPLEPDPLEPAPNDRFGTEADPLVQNLRQLATLAAQERRLVDAFTERLQPAGPPVPIIGIGEKVHPVSDLDDIEAISTTVAAGMKPG